MTLTPERILEDITRWTLVKNRLSIQKQDNLNAHFNIMILSDKPHLLKSITVAYPKNNGDKILMGWGWRLQAMDTKAYAAIKERARKESIMSAITEECKARNLTIRLLPNEMDRLEEMKVHRYLHINDFNESAFKK